MNRTFPAEIKHVYYFKIKIFFSKNVLQYVFRVYSWMFSNAFIKKLSKQVEEYRTTAILQ